MIDRFGSLAASTGRTGIVDLVQHLKDIGFFTAPSSSQHHGCFVGGLYKHSVSVAEIGLKLRNAVAPQVSAESVIVAGLFHDVGKSGYYNQQYYVENLLKGGKKSEAKPYKHNDERPVEIEHSIASLHIVSKFIQLLPEEVQAIVYHNGLYIPSGRDISGKEHPLTLLIHWADMWASRVTESNKNMKSCEVLF